MGGHHHMQNNYLSPSGGWFFIPKNWRINTVYVAIGAIGVCFLTYRLGERSKVVANTEYDDETISRWNSAAKKARESSAITKVTGQN